MSRILAVKQKVGGERQVIVMLDACFTGETGRKGEALLAVSAPGSRQPSPGARPASLSSQPHPARRRQTGTMARSSVCSPAAS